MACLLAPASTWIPTGLGFSSRFTWMQMAVIMAVTSGPTLSDCTYGTSCMFSTITPSWKQDQQKLRWLISTTKILIIFFFKFRPSCDWKKFKVTKHMNICGSWQRFSQNFRDLKKKKIKETSTQRFSQRKEVHCFHVINNKHDKFLYIR